MHTSRKHKIRNENPILLPIKPRLQENKLQITD